MNKKIILYIITIITITCLSNYIFYNTAKAEDTGAGTETNTETGSDTGIDTDTGTDTGTEADRKSVV